MTCLNPGPSTKISATVLQYSSVGGWDCMQMPILLFLNLYACRTYKLMRSVVSKSSSLLPATYLAATLSTTDCKVYRVKVISDGFIGNKRYEDTSSLLPQHRCKCAVMDSALFGGGQVAHITL